MADEATSEADIERIVRMLLDAGLVEETPLQDGRVALRLTERGRQLQAALPDVPELELAPDDGAAAAAPSSTDTPGDASDAGD